MGDVVKIMRERQLAIRREIERRGIAIKAIEFDSGIKHSTLLSYFPNSANTVPVSIPMLAVFQLLEGNALPLDLIGMLLPASLALVTVPEEMDHTDAAAAMHSYLAVKNGAHHPDSPAGIDISECEDARLRASMALVRSVAA